VLCMQIKSFSGLFFIGNGDGEGKPMQTEQSPMGYFFYWEVGGGINSFQLWLPCLRVGEQTSMGYIFSWGGGVNSCKLWFRVIDQTLMGYFFNEGG